MSRWRRPGPASTPSLPCSPSRATSRSTRLTPAACVLFSPWLDLTLSGASMHDRAGDDPVLTPGALAESARMYGGAGEDLTRPLVSPLFADLAGLPPMLILVGTAEVLLDDAR